MKNVALQPLVIPTEEIRDDQLKSAYVESAECGSTLPLLKQELKSKIQYKRLLHGHPELKVSFVESPKYPLTKEEIERKENRKRNNRISAKKCRMKKKSELFGKSEELQKLQLQNEYLKRRVSDLENMKLKLSRQVSSFVSSTMNIHIPPDPQNVLSHVPYLKEMLESTKLFNVQPN